MATSAAIEEPELKHWLGVLLVIMITGIISAVIPVILYFV